MASVTVTECEAYLRLSAGTDTTLITILRDAADSFIEGNLGIGLTSAARDDYLDGGGNALVPRTYPVTAITQVYDEEEEAAEDSDNYYLRGNWLIRRNGGGRWPEGDGQLGRGRYRVTYMGGYADGGAPARVKQLALMLLARAYENRTGAATEVSAGHTVAFQSFVGSDVWNLARSLKPGGLVG